MVLSQRYSRHSVKEEDVIDFLQGNVLNWRMQGYLGEDRLRSNAGFLLGWMAAQCLPLPAHVNRTVF
jgi:hypothetical protein